MPNTNNRLDGSVFPEIFCIEEIHCVRLGDGGYDYRASLYHDHASLTVTFIAAERNAQLRRGRFVSVEWLTDTIFGHGALMVGGLCVRDCAASGFNPFQSVPHSWCVDRHQIECARDLRDASSQQLRKQLFDTFWRGLHARHTVDSGGACER